MRVAIVGAGALGLYYGALLQRSGEDVRFLLRRDYEAIRTAGLRVHSVDDDFHLQPVKGYLDSAEIGEVDLVLVGLKTFSNRRMNQLIRPLVGKTTTILTLQNGLGNEEVLAENFDEDQIMGGIAFLCANRGEPGTVHHLGQGAIRIGHFRRKQTDRGKRVAELFRTAGISCESVEDLLKARWEKLVWNIPFNGLTALTGKTVTTLLNHSASRQLAETIMEEVVKAANAQELSTPIDGTVFITKMIAATETMGNYRPSMMIDRMENRPLELDSIYAQPLRRAAEKSISTPHIRMLYALLDLGEKSFQNER